MPNTFAHGKLVAVQLQGTYAAVLGVDWNSQLSDLENITFTVQGGVTYGVFLPGYRIGDATIDFVWDSSNIFAIDAGTLVALIFTLDGTNLFTVSAWCKHYHIASAGPTKGPVKGTITLQSTGSYTVPN
jgi:hypothetical protein